MFLRDVVGLKHLWYVNWLRNGCEVLIASGLGGHGTVRVRTWISKSLELRSVL